MMYTKISQRESLVLECNCMLMHDTHDQLARHADDSLGNFKTVNTDVMA